MNVNQDDLRALFNLIEQASLAIAEPIPNGGIQSCRENLNAAMKLAQILLEHH